MKPISQTVDEAKPGKIVKLVRLNAESVARMKRHLDGRTDAKLTARFGISYNTWRKIAAGEGVRASVAARLLVRLSTLEVGIRPSAND
jgi:hypothetical protein